MVHEAAIWRSPVVCPQALLGPADRLPVSRMDGDKR